MRLYPVIGCSLWALLCAVPVVLVLTDTFPFPPVYDTQSPFDKDKKAERRDRLFELSCILAMLFVFSLYVSTTTAKIAGMQPMLYADAMSPGGYRMAQQFVAHTDLESMERGTKFGRLLAIMGGIACVTAIGETVGLLALPDNKTIFVASAALVGAALMMYYGLQRSTRLVEIYDREVASSVVVSIAFAHACVLAALEGIATPGLAHPALATLLLAAVVPPFLYFNSFHIVSMLSNSDWTSIIASGTGSFLLVGVTSNTLSALNYRMTHV